MKLFDKAKRHLQDLTKQDEQRLPIQFIGVFILLGSVSLVMTVINIITGFRALMFATAIFAAANAINVLLVVKNEKHDLKPARTLFSAELLALFIFFIVSGEPEGFSVIWTAMLPTCGLVLYGRRNGTIFSAGMLAVILFFFWTPFGMGLLNFSYTQSFMLRFPFLYAAFYFVALLLETLRAYIQSELMSARDKYQALSTHDALTGLENRYGFNRRMDEMISQKKIAAMAIVDVDYFKQVNDTYGHINGDTVLRAIASDLCEDVGAEGTVCRWGGEEFGILFENADTAHVCCNKILKHRRSTSVDLTDTMCKVTVSIGLITVPASIQVSAAELVRQTDENLYSAKNSGRDRLCSGSYSVTAKETVNQQLNEREISISKERALADGEFEIYYQPQYSHTTGRMVGVEALSRWNHPKFGYLMPTEYVPVFEKNGFISQLDLYVFEDACAMQRRCLDAGIPIVPISFNISRKDICSEEYLANMETIRAKYDIPTSLLRAEVAESCVMSGTELISKAVEHMHALGYIVEMDDFGSGYSSLNVLKDINFDIVKLDMAFLSGDIRDRGGVIISGLVRMLRWLDCPVIAEGVETVAQADYMKSIGCDCVQGFLYSKPVIGDEFFDLLKKSETGVFQPTQQLIENMDAHRFWDAESIETLLFSSYVGAAAIFTYENGTLELLRINSKYMSEFGMLQTEHDVLTAAALNAFEGDGLEIFKATVKRAIMSGKEEECETWRTVTSQCCGKEQMCIRTSMRVIERQDEIYTFYALVRNVTSEKQNLAEMADNTRRFRAASEQANIYYWEYDVLTHEMRPCFRCMRDLGLPALVKNYPDTAIEMGIFPQDYADLYRDWHRRIANGEKYLEGVIPLTADKIPYIVRYTTEFDIAGRPVKAYGSAIRLTTPADRSAEVGKTADR